MADKIEVLYPDLKNNGSNFRTNADTVQQIEAQIKAGVDQLRATWEGRGADAFFREMEDIVFPGLRKLQAALGEAADTTTQIATIFEQAETEASAKLNQ